MAASEGSTVKDETVRHWAVQQAAHSATMEWYLLISPPLLLLHAICGSAALGSAKY